MIENKETWKTIGITVIGWVIFTYMFYNMVIEEIISSVSAIVLMIFMIAETTFLAKMHIIEISKEKNKRGKK